MKRLLFLSLSALLVLVSAPARAATITVEDGFEELSLGKSLELAYDPSGALTVDDMLAGKLQFAPSTKDVPSFGYRSGAEWARFTLADSRTRDGELAVQLQYAPTDEFDVFVVRDGAASQVASLGDHRPRPREFASGRLATTRFSTNAHPTVYVRLGGGASHQLGLRLFSISRAADAIAQDIFRQALYFGALLSILAYNALLFVGTRIRVYRTYSLFLFAWLGFQVMLSGLGSSVLDFRGSAADKAVPMAMAAMFLPGVWFAAELLSLVESVSRRSWWVLRSVAFAMLLGAVLAPYAVAMHVALGGAALWVFAMIWLGVNGLATERSTARLYLGAWAALLAGVLLNLLVVLGYAPASLGGAQQIGSAIEFILLSFALANRIKQLQADATKNAELAHAATATMLAEQERTNAELTRLAALKDEFLANTSHELRTPLNGIVGMAESLAATSSLDARSKTSANAILDASKRLTALVGDILDFGALGAAPASATADVVEAHDVDLGAVVLHEAAALSPALATMPVQLQVLVGRGEHGVRGDEARLGKIVRALFSNAVKFTDAGSVRVRARRDGDFVELLVEDEGCGIPKNRLASIFTAFEQGDGGASRKHGGTGLGLALAKKNTELMGGTIEVRSTEGVGTTVLVRLPRGEVPAQPVVRETSTAAVAASPQVHAEYRQANDGIRVHDAVAGSATNVAPVRIGARNSLPPASIQGDLRRARVLVVDDDELNRDVIASHLIAEPFDLVSAPDGASALALLETDGPFDAVLLDVMMPGLTGYDVCKRVRQRLGPTDLPVLLVTAKTQASDLAEGFSSGANDFLHKPVSRLELRARLLSHLAIARASIAMRRFVPEETVRLLGHEDLTAVRLGDAVEAPLTVAFSDLRGFTARVEHLTPGQAFQWLNGCYAKLGPEVRAHGGFIDKYIGDGSLALFPRSPRDAVEAAIAMHHALDELGDVRMGSGLHLGPTMLGTLGEPERFEATVLSDAVNLASRIEGASKFFGARVLVSRAVVDAVGAESFAFRRLGRVRVKGRTQAVELYEVLNADSEDDRRKKLASAESFARAVAAFESGALHEAMLFMQTVLDGNAGDGPAWAYATQLARLVEAGDESADGVFVLNEK